MSISKGEDLQLKIGNFFLAAVLSAVPTVMTIGFLGVHGLIVCKNLEKRIDNSNSSEVNVLCEKSNLESSYSYIVWIWLFIMLPTWRWFYIGHYRRVQHERSEAS